MPRFLIVKCSSLGDIIHSFPVAHYLKMRYPGCVVDWVVEARCRELVERHSGIDGVIVIDSKRGDFARGKLRGERYDVLFDLQGNSKSGLVTSLAKAKRKVGFGRKSVAELPNLLATRQRHNPPPGQNIRHDYLHLVRSHFGDTAPFIDPGTELRLTPEECQQVDQIPLSTRTLLLCPFASWQSKQLPPSFIEQVIADHPNHQVWVLWGTEQERQAAEALNIGELLPKLSLPALQRVMARVSLVVSADSLPLHLAGTTRTPTLALFGPSSAQKYNPTAPHNRAMQGECPYGEQFEKRCSRLRTCHEAPCRLVTRQSRSDQRSARQGESPHSPSSNHPS